jgi:uncharacterized membrane protein
MVIAQDPFSSLLWNIGHAFCHQLPERSLFFSGFQMPVCARDTGTYLGFLIVFAFWLGLRRYRNVSRPDALVLISSVAAMLPFLLDGIASYLGLYTTNNTVRLFTGLLMGAAMGLVLLSVFPLIAVKSTEARKAFTRKDLIPIFAMVLAAGILIISMDLGTIEFYALETLSIAGILILLFTAILTLMHFGLRATRFQMVRSSPFIVILAIILETGLISILWYLHDAVTLLMG